MHEALATIYEDYASVMQGRGPSFDHAAARRWGKAYDHFFRGWLPASKDAAIADIACGSGQLLLFLKDRGYTQVNGVDGSASQVRLAKQVVDGVREQDVLEFLAANQGSFDLITGIDIIEHLGKDEAMRFLGLCRGALRQGGRLILQTPNLGSPMGASVRYGDFTHELGFTPELLGRILVHEGFTDIEARELGPVARGYSLSSTLRHVAWRFLRGGIRLMNLVETGGVGSPVCSRVFLISGRKS